MASMAAKGIVLPAIPMTAMAMGLEDQSSEMSSMAMAAHRKLKKVNSDEALPVSCRTCFSQERMTYIQIEAKSKGILKKISFKLTIS